LRSLQAARASFATAYFDEQHRKQAEARVPFLLVPFLLVPFLLVPFLLVPFLLVPFLLVPFLLVPFLLARKEKTLA
jgi:hypothetical protein